MAKKWFVYIVKTNINTLYTGITTDIRRRLYEHNNDKNKGAKSLRGKQPVTLVYSEKHTNQHEARIRELQIKKWNSGYKWKLVERNKQQKNKILGLPSKFAHELTGAIAQR